MGRRAPGSGVMLGSQGAPLSSLGKVCNLGNPSAASSCLFTPLSFLLLRSFLGSFFSPSPLPIFLSPCFLVFLFLPALGKSPPFSFSFFLFSFSPPLPFFFFSLPPFFYSPSLPLTPLSPHPFCPSLSSIYSSHGPRKVCWGEGLHAKTRIPQVLISLTPIPHPNVFLPSFPCWGLGPALGVLARPPIPSGLLGKSVWMLTGAVGGGGEDLKRGLMAVDSAPLRKKGVDREEHEMDGYREVKRGGN